MTTHIVLTRTAFNKTLNIIVPLESASFTEDTEGNVLLRTDKLAVNIDQSMQDIIEMIKPIGFYKKC